MLLVLRDSRTALIAPAVCIVIIESSELTRSTLPWEVRLKFADVALYVFVNFVTDDRHHGMSCKSIVLFAEGKGESVTIAVRNIGLAILDDVKVALFKTFKSESSVNEHNRTGGARACRCHMRCRAHKKIFVIRLHREPDNF